MAKDVKKGWNEFDSGTMLFPFKEDVKVSNISTTPQEDRPYSEFNSYKSSAADWRVLKPIFNQEACINCHNCWIFCPDVSIISKDKKVIGIDYDHCKGCGVCVEVCPANPKALLMFEEKKDEKEALAEWPQKEKK